MTFTFAKLQVLLRPVIALKKGRQKLLKVILIKSKEKQSDILRQHCGAFRWCHWSKNFWVGKVTQTTWPLISSPPIWYQSLYLHRDTAVAMPAHWSPVHVTYYYFFLLHNISCMVYVLLWKNKKGRGGYIYRSFTLCVSTK